MGGMERPDVDKVSGLSPVIAIEQKTTSKNPRSTVGTITEIYDFMRLLFARAGEAFSYVTGEKMVRYSDDQIIELILEKFKPLDGLNALRLNDRIDRLETVRNQAAGAVWVLKALGVTGVIAGILGIIKLAVSIVK